MPLPSRPTGRCWRTPKTRTLALAGRDEPSDFVDIVYIHEWILQLGALWWAAAGKDPGFTPRSLLELLGLPRIAGSDC